MKVNMPYGTIDINSKEDVVRFIKNRCNNCPFSKELWSCSGNQAKLCEEKETEMLNAFGMVVKE